MLRALTRSGLYILLVFALVSLISGALWAGQNRGRFRTGVAPGKFPAGRSFVHGGPIYPVYPYGYGRYQPYYPPLVRHLALCRILLRAADHRRDRAVFLCVSQRGVCKPGRAAGSSGRHAQNSPRRRCFVVPG